MFKDGRSWWASITESEKGMWIRLCKRHKLGRTPADAWRLWQRLFEWRRQGGESMGCAW